MFETKEQQEEMDKLLNDVQNGSDSDANDGPAEALMRGSEELAQLLDDAEQHPAGFRKDDFNEFTEELSAINDADDFRTVPIRYKVIVAYFIIRYRNGGVPEEKCDIKLIASRIKDEIGRDYPY